MYSMGTRLQCSKEAVWLRIRIIYEVEIFRGYESLPVIRTHGLEIYNWQEYDIIQLLTRLKLHRFYCDLLACNYSTKKTLLGFFFSV